MKSKWTFDRGLGRPKKKGQLEGYPSINREFTITIPTFFGKKKGVIEENVFEDSHFVGLKEIKNYGYENPDWVKATTKKEEKLARNQIKKIMKKLKKVI